MVELGGLGGGVEDAQGLGVHAAAGAPLPAAIVGGQVAIHQVLHEEALAQAPVADQVLHQVGGHDHARSVVHPAALHQLPHRRIHDRHAGEARLPDSQPLRVVLPGEMAPLGPVGTIGQLGEMEQGLLVELAPAELLLPHRDRGQGLVAAGGEAGHGRGGPGLAGAEGAEAQGGREGRGAGFPRQVAPFVVAGQGRAISEGFELGQGCRLAGTAGAEVGAGEGRLGPPSGAPSAWFRGAGAAGF